MPQFTPSQQRALSLDPSAHASVLGAPGSGKTTLIAEAFARIAALPEWREEHLLILAPNRLAATRLRTGLEQRLEGALGGTPVRTPASLAFAVLARERAAAGRAAPRLLTGTAQDEALARVLENWGPEEFGGWSPAPEVVASQRFRAELRELTRVLDDFDLEAGALAARLATERTSAAEQARTRAPEPELIERWIGALAVVDRAARALAVERPGELTSSGLLREAAAVLHAGDAGGVPRLILIDDAQELGEGELALVAACVALGSTVWAFGDPDLATGAFHGERAELLTRLSGELARRGGTGADSHRRAEQRLVLEEVHRHGHGLRQFVRALTGRIGAAGAGEQRAAAAVSDAGPAAQNGAETTSGAHGSVQFTRATSPAEQLGVLAHRLRARHLGLGGGEPLPWREMAVLCRSRAEAARAARLLAGQQVPTGVSAGGLVLREHRIVRELVMLLRHALGIAELDAAGVLELLGGVVGSLDAVAVRRLRGALLVQERRQAAADGREPWSIPALVAEAFVFPGDRPVVDSAGGRALRRLGLVAAAGRRVDDAGGTPREVLWALWDATGLASRWQEEALALQGVRSDAADRALDAVMGLFFHLQRHEEQASEQPIDEVLAELLASDVPEDTLAARAERDEVTVTTPQGAVGREFALVAVLGPQDGAWPNLRAQGSLLGVSALERWLRGDAAAMPSRRDTLHDELRLFALACSRAAGELLVIAVADENQHPSPFFGFGREDEVHGLPSARLTLRGAVGELRRRLEADPDDTIARDSLAALAAEQVPGAHPDEWYGVLPPSSADPLVDLAGDPEASVRLSPSHLETAETCPLDWAIRHLGGGESTVSSNLGTLLHRAFEIAGALATTPEPAQLLEVVESEWAKLPFEAEWEAERTRRLAMIMTQGIVDYLTEFAGSHRVLLGNEAAFAVSVGRAILTGKADRIEARTRADGGTEVSILDLKTGTTPPSKAALEDHAQLRAYQLGFELGGFALEGAGAAAPTAPGNGGARLLYVHPKAVRRGASFTEFGQEPTSADAREGFEARISAVAEVMAAGRFTARVEHHCRGGHFSGQCKIHVIPAVSHA